MDIQKSFQDALQIILLKEPVMNSVAKDKSALKPALILALAAAVVGTLGAYFFPVSYGVVTYRLDIASALAQMVSSSLLLVGGLYFVGYLAESVFHSKLDMQAYVQVMGHAAVLGMLGIFPPLGVVSGLWSLVVMCFVLHKLGKMSAGAIIALIILFGIAAMVVGATFAMFGFTGGVIGSGMMSW